MHKNIMANRPFYLLEITVNKLFTAVTPPVHSRYDRSTVAGPTGRQGPSDRSPAVGTCEGWVTSYGVCGHLLDSLSACDHSATLMKPEQAHFGRLYVRMFFWKDLPQTEGRRNADLLIKTEPAGDTAVATTGVAMTTGRCCMDASGKSVLGTGPQV